MFIVFLLLSLCETKKANEKLCVCVYCFWLNQCTKFGKIVQWFNSRAMLHFESTVSSRKLAKLQDVTFYTHNIYKHWRKKHFQKHCAFPSCSRSILVVFHSVWKIRTFGFQQILDLYIKPKQFLITISANQIVNWQNEKLKKRTTTMKIATNRCKLKLTLRYSFTAVVWRLKHEIMSKKNTCSHQNIRAQQTDHVI